MSSCNELKPCPFCGGKAHLIKVYCGFFDTRYYVKCGALYPEWGEDDPDYDENKYYGCGISQSSCNTYNSRQAAIDDWNTRYKEEQEF